MQPFGEDHEKQFIYKEPKVTALAELTLRLQKLYSRKFGSKEIVHIIQESGRVKYCGLQLRLNNAWELHAFYSHPLTCADVQTQLHEDLI